MENSREAAVTIMVPEGGERPFAAICTNVSGQPTFAAAFTNFKKGGKQSFAALATKVRHGRIADLRCGRLPMSREGGERTFAAPIPKIAVERKAVFQC